ncbi:thiol-disulfide oxidoreductase DCC family protein [Chitinophaga niabensis]|uniref:Predicted thiol-disulfide oxidoreductase YuxK, DCC family n=1 Tax=Chitinophaga niabensis TaxID=536979 RepID=A0A1N6E8Y2_9BACT|nr:thiol-disulfide oxidoreductase DCC family protein [Chitinophaga niabensis]SIN79494.1 Predicted thiol-disulfide oxidoreductase YuxK, DCC family [Chitinophaga niabensis]
MSLIILFDGVCKFCNGSVNFVIRHDKHNRFKFAPLQSAAGQDLLQQHGLKNNMDSFVLIDNDKAYTRSTAVLRVLRHLGFPYYLLYAGIVIPVGLRNLLYSWFAKNRYRWFGKKDQCMVPDEKVRKKFL